MNRLALASLTLLVVLAVPASGWGAKPRAKLTITQPTAAVPVELRRHARVFWAPVVVQGKARRGRIVTVAIPCRGGTCIRTATASRKGRWKTTVEVLRHRPGPVRITARIGTAQTARRTVALAPPVTPVPRAGKRYVVMIGDSLAEGTADLLPDALPDYNVSTHAVSGRPLLRGLEILRLTPLPARPVLAFSLFTNDDPRNTFALEQAVRTGVARAGARGCSVWATIRRPKVGGRTYSGANHLLHRLAGEYGSRLQIVPWAEETGRRRALMSKDKVHPTAAGYERRAELYAEAVARCNVDVPVAAD